MTRFDDTTAVRPVSGPGGPEEGRAVFNADLDESWRSLLGVHGGYVTALTVRAAEAMLPDRAVRTVSASFLRPTVVGPVDIHLDVLRSGRSFSTVAARVLQGGRSVVETRVTMLNVNRTSGDMPDRSWTSQGADRPPPLDRCVPFEPPPAISHFAQAELRIDPGAVPTGDASDARVAGHVRPVEPRAFDVPWLVMIGDWFPPSPFQRLAPPTGGVSIDYTVHVHRVPSEADGPWLEGVFESPENVDGIALEHGTLSTRDGSPVAETFHSRWTG